jgi:hypothetical protein
LTSQSVGFEPQGPLERTWELLLTTAFLFGFGCLIPGLIFLLVWTVGLPVSLSTLGWSPVSAQVIYAYAGPCAPRSPHTHALELNYRFQGQSYLSWSGDRPRSVLLPGTFPGNARASAHPAYFQAYGDCGVSAMNKVSGTAQIVYVDPKDPSQAVLHRGPPWPQGASWWLIRAALLLAIARGMVTLVPQLRRWQEHDTKRG